MSNLIEYKVRGWGEETSKGRDIKDPWRRESMGEFGV